MKFCVHNERKTIMLDVLLLSNFLLFFLFCPRPHFNSRKNFPTKRYDIKKEKDKEEKKNV